ncbi:hypothetical protein MOV61_21955 [Neorhizobium sp. BETTINA12A]|uniref:hypothetical protein n=1 Tax=Neorhizobium sp. BETTINA12A TaxID=2908924 RepID=UPI001FF615F7|nr:hypothetical protein [Neorhizobium sp. BETTINA12A]MCJ9753388.1 hypothetical protein [Neorhizobium sp. BETTINA12A]
MAIFSFRALSAKMAQNRVKEALPAMDLRPRGAKKRAKPAFSGVLAICNFSLWQQFKKLFLANFR